MEKNRKKTKRGKKVAFAFEKRTSQTGTKAVKYVDYLLELHKLQGAILHRLGKEL